MLRRHLRPLRFFIFTRFGKDMKNEKNLNFTRKTGSSFSE